MSERRHRGASALRGAALALIAAAGLAACGSSGGARTVPRRPRTNTTTSHTTTTTSTATTTSTTTQTTTQPGQGKPQINLGDQNTTEQFVLGELYDLALSSEGYSVTITRNVGPPAVRLQALRQGGLDMYPEYLNVWDDQMVGYTRPIRTAAYAYVVGAKWAQEHALQLLTPTPGADSTTFAVSAKYAARNHLRTLIDLARLAPSLTAGVPLEFTKSPTGLPAIEHAYAFQPRKVISVQAGDQYGDLQSGSAEAVYATTTDPQLTSKAYRVLGDPRHAEGFGNIAPVVTTATLASEGPTFVQMIDRVDALLTTAALRQLNAEVDLMHEEPAVVAQNFLVAHHLIPTSSTLG